MPQRSDAHDAIRARGVSKAAALPAGQLLRMLLPGQKLPPGAVVVRVPQLTQRVSARMAVAAGTMLPDDTTEGVGAQEAVVSAEGTAEGTAEGSTEGAAEGVAEEVQTPPPPPANPFDMIRTAMDRKSDALLEQNAARALQKRALSLQV